MIFKFKPPPVPAVKTPRTYFVVVSPDQRTDDAAQGVAKVILETSRSVQFALSFEPCHLKYQVPAKAVGIKLNEPFPVTAVIFTTTGVAAMAPVVSCPSRPKA